MRLSYLFILLAFTNCSNQKNKPIESQGINTPDPIIVDPPKSVSTIIYPDDSTYLNIKLDTANYKISFLNIQLSTNDIEKVDDFISTNKYRIDKDKILIEGNSHIPYVRFKELKKILKKHELFKFKIVANP